MRKKTIICTNGRGRKDRYVYIPEHPNSWIEGYMLESRLVMEKKIDRLLRREEIVHHIDGNPLNNKPENLQLFKTHLEHLSKAHGSIIKFENIKKLIGNETLNKSELQDRIMDKFKCNYTTAYKAINKYIDNFEVWIGNSDGSNFPSKFFKNIEFNKNER